MTFKEAFQNVEREQELKAASAGDCGDRWIFHFEAYHRPKADEISPEINALPDSIKELILSVDCTPVPVFVFKNDGRCEHVYNSEYAYLLERGEISYKPISLPK